MFIMSSFCAIAVIQYVSGLNQSSRYLEIARARQRQRLYFGPAAIVPIALQPIPCGAACTGLCHAAAATTMTCDGYTRVQLFEGECA